MAVSPNNDEAFLREVDEELRRDELLSLWKRYGRIALIVVGVGLLAFAGFLFWQHQQEKGREVEGEQLSAAIADLQAQRTDPAGVKLKELVGSGNPAYVAVARFDLATLAAQKNDLKGASKIYGEIIADPKAPQPYRDLALLRQTALDFDTLPPATVVDRLKPLAVEGNAWFGSAGEMTAMAYLAMNKRTDAGRLFAAIASDAKQPQTLRARASRLANSLGVDVAAPGATAE